MPFFNQITTQEGTAPTLMCRIIDVDATSNPTTNLWTCSFIKVDDLTAHQHISSYYTLHQDSTLLILETKLLIPFLELCFLRSSICFSHLQITRKVLTAV